MAAVAEVTTYLRASSLARSFKSSFICKQGQQLFLARSFVLISFSHVEQIKRMDTTPLGQSIGRSVCDDENDVRVRATEKRKNENFLKDDWLSHCFLSLALAIGLGAKTMVAIVVGYLPHTRSLTCSNTEIKQARLWKGNRGAWPGRLEIRPPLLFPILECTDL